MEKRRVLWLLFTLFFLWTAEDVATVRAEAAGPDATVILRESEDGGRRRNDDDEDDRDKDKDDDEEDDDDDDRGSRKSSRRKRASDEEEDEDEDEEDGKFPLVPVLIAVFSVLAVVLVVLIIILLSKNGKNSRSRDGRTSYPAPDPYRSEDAYRQPEYRHQDQYQEPAYRQPDPYPQPEAPLPQEPYPQPQGYDVPPVMGREGDTVVLGKAQNPGVDDEETLTMNIKRGPFVVISDPYNPQRVFRAEIRHHVVIGRKPPAEIILDYDTGVSGSHCEIVNDGGTFYLKDLNSVNGTVYNGVSVREPIPIQSGGKLRIGRYEYDLKFED